MKFTPPKLPKLLNPDDWSRENEDSDGKGHDYYALEKALKKFHKAWKRLDWVTVDLSKGADPTDNLSRQDLKSLLKTVEIHVKFDIMRLIESELEAISDEATLVSRGASAAAKKFYKKTAKTAESFKKDLPKEIMDQNEAIAKALGKIVEAREKEQKRKAGEIRKAIAAVARVMPTAKTVDAFNAFRRNEVGGLAFLLAKHAKDLGTEKDYQVWKRFAAEGFDVAAEADISARLRLLVPAVKALAKTIP